MYKTTLREISNTRRWNLFLLNGFTVNLEKHNDITAIFQRSILHIFWHWLKILYLNSLGKTIKPLESKKKCAITHLKQAYAGLIYACHIWLTTMCTKIIVSVLAAGGFNVCCIEKKLNPIVLFWKKKFPMNFKLCMFCIFFSSDF